jgi:hypothetical protein
MRQRSLASEWRKPSAGTTVLALVFSAGIAMGRLVTFVLKCARLSICGPREPC